MDRTSPDTLPTEVRQSWPGFPWTFFLAVFALSLPLWVLGGLSSTRLMPGLPLSALMFSCTAFVACLFAYCTDGMPAVGRLLARSLDFGRIGSAIWYVPTVLLMPGVLLAAYAIMRFARFPLPAPQVMWSQTPVLFRW
jgi:hypothetical protein